MCSSLAGALCSNRGNNSGEFTSTFGGNFNQGNKFRTKCRCSLCVHVPVHQSAIQIQLEGSEGQKGGEGVVTDQRKLSSETRRKESLATRSASLDVENLSDQSESCPGAYEKVFLNVGGKSFCTFRHTLKTVPRTRLSELMKCPVEMFHPNHYDTQTKQFFFDRHPAIFEYILNYYRTGELHVPRDICWPVFNNELAFWGLDHTHLESCCWQIYRNHEDNENTLKALDEEDKQESVDPRLLDKNSSACERRLAHIWEMCDDPMSSKMAKAFALLSLTLILASVALFCLETHEYFVDTRLINTTEVMRDGSTRVLTKKVVEPKQYLLYVEAVCVAWFCFEIVLRLISCPDKCQFVKSPLNIIDILAVLPFFFSFMDTSQDGENQAAGVLRVIRILRVFRVFKLTRHSTGLKILWHTLHASMKELFILGIFMCLGVVIFASLIYYAERLFASSEHEVETDFIDIPHGFWWALVTMTTLGYGDMVPRTFAGQLVGSLCALCGLLTIALPVPVIVSNFSLYYSHYQAKSKLPRNQQQNSALKEGQPDEANLEGMSDSDTDGNPTSSSARKFSNSFYAPQGIPPHMMASKSTSDFMDTSKLPDTVEEEENEDHYLRFNHTPSPMKHNNVFPGSTPPLPTSLSPFSASTSADTPDLSPAATSPNSLKDIPYIDLSPANFRCGDYPV